MLRLPANVKRGAAMLDERLPGWRSVVDADTLWLGNCEECVLGQVFGTYERGCAALGLRWREAFSYGFTLGPRGGSWDRLTAAWRKVIA